MIRKGLCPGEVGNHQHRAQTRPDKVSGNTCRIRRWTRALSVYVVQGLVLRLNRRFSGPRVANVCHYEPFSRSGPIVVVLRLFQMGSKAG